MSYNTDHLRTAGKITVYTTLIGVVAFAVIFIFNIGENTVRHADAQSNATTSVTVVNTPPVWTASTTELVQSSISNPTNAGDTLSWVAVGTDSNNEDYYLLICSTADAPTANSSAAPNCSAGVQWAVSGQTISGTQATAATTTLSSWVESNDWYGWICDHNGSSPRCNATYSQGTNATNSSPFEINHRPVFTSFIDDSPAVPGQPVTFTTVSSDPDTSGGSDFDTVFLTVCSVAGFDTTTNSCNGIGAITLATSTMYFSSNATATYTIRIPTQDQDYGAFGYIIDHHGFEASGGSQGTDSTLSVSNAAPTVSAASISVNGGLPMSLSVESGETTGFTLSFTTSDNNSCENTTMTPGSEITGYNLSLYRSGVGSTTCTVGAGSYNPNSCYPSGVATTTWNLSCTPNTGTCADENDTDMTWSCTFPLWYIADPTDGIASTTQYAGQSWVAQVQGIDDDAAVGSTTESSSGVNVNSLLAFSLSTLSIVYGSLEPGQQTDPLVATSTILATGNVGLNKDVYGQSMCPTYTGATPCAPSATSTIPVTEQVFATTKTAYASATTLQPSTTPQVVLIKVPKSTATSTQESRNAYWGIRVPATISFAGDYTGENTFTAIVSNSADW